MPDAQEIATCNGWLQREIELLHFLQALVVTDGVLAARQPLEAVARQKAFFHRVQAPPRVASTLVDEQVVHNAREP